MSRAGKAPIRMIAAAGAVLLAGVVAMSPAAAEGTLGLQPYLYNPPPDTLSGAQRQGATSYETKLNSNARRLQLENNAGNTRELNRVRREQNRMKGILARPSTPRAVQPAPRSSFRTPLRSTGVARSYGGGRSIGVGRR